MKPANVLVFRDQRVKVGDLGTSIILDDDDDLDTPKYILKGISKEYATSFMFKACEISIKVSKRQLFEADRHAVLKTFEKTLKKIKKIETQSHL